MTLFVIITMQIPSPAGYKVGTWKGNFTFPDDFTRTQVYTEVASFRIPPEFRDGSVLFFSAEPDQYNPGA